MERSRLPCRKIEGKILNRCLLQGYIPIFVSLLVNAALVSLMALCRWYTPAPTVGAMQVSLTDFFSPSPPPAAPAESTLGRGELDYKIDIPVSPAAPSGSGLLTPPLPIFTLAAPPAPIPPPSLQITDRRLPRIEPTRPAPSSSEPATGTAKSAGATSSSGASGALRSLGGTPPKKPGSRKAGLLQVQGGRVLVVMVTDGPMVLVPSRHREELRRLASGGELVNMKDEGGARMSKALCEMVTKKATSMKADAIYWITPLANESDPAAVKRFREWLRTSGVAFYLCSWGYPSEELLSASKESGGAYEQLCFHQPEMLEVEINPQSLEEVESRVMSLGEPALPKQSGTARLLGTLQLLYRHDDVGMVNRLYTGRLLEGRQTDGLVVKFPGVPTPVNLFRHEITEASWEKAEKAWSTRRY